MTRELIVVDVETTGLDPARHVVLEVAAVNVHSGQELHFAPRVEPGALEAADPNALRLNRYFERGVFEMVLRADVEDEAWVELATMLDGNTLAGSNPTFDSAMLSVSGRVPECWHHRLADLAAYAAPALGLEPDALPGLEAVCAALGVVNAEPHSALGDARATAECFRRLILRYRDAVIA